MFSLAYKIHYNYNVCIYGQIIFEWDEQKAESNKQKHGVAFEEARTVFYDENARLIYDPEHSTEEDRYLLLGMSSSLQLLLVCHLYKENDELIRIISVRKATKNEPKQYFDFLS